MPFGGQRPFLSLSQLISNPLHSFDVLSPTLIEDM